MIPASMRLFQSAGQRCKSSFAFGFWLLFILSTACTKIDTADISINKVAGQSPYISKVFEYMYAPGQHAGMVAADDKGHSFIGIPWTNNKSFTSLGGWGGYIIAGFDHAVINAKGADIAIFTQPSVSSEPGIVSVMEDTNNDGMPNDGVWYQLKGSEYNHPETIHNYQVTYYKPGTSGLVTWKDNKGGSGTLTPLYGSENWWWKGYGDKQSVVFTGDRLPDAYSNVSTDPTVPLWIVRNGLFQFGYAECYSNLDFNTNLKANLLDLDQAVDGSGMKITLNRVHFIKIQSAVFQIAGWLNEISTEVSGAADLNLLDKSSY